MTETTAESSRSVMLADVLEGLSLPQKEISAKYFYDTRGSELFEQITHTSEYYPTRTERDLLERCIPLWVGHRRPAALVELGAGSARKSRVVLDAMRRHDTGNVYVPVDVSGEFLHETAAGLRDEYAGLVVLPEVADITEPLQLSHVPPDPAWYALLGSTIGNFDEVHAVRLLCRVASGMRATDHFLLGADLRPGPRKSVERLEAAYNDAAGVTARFNLNVLRVLNRELGSDFDIGAYRHHAFYNGQDGRIEMHLVADGEQRVRFADGTNIRLDVGESIRTEISCKYDRRTLERLLGAAGMVIDEWAEDSEGLFALTLARTAP